MWNGTARRRSPEARKRTADRPAGPLAGGCGWWPPSRAAAMWWWCSGKFSPPPAICRRMPWWAGSPSWAVSSPARSPAPACSPRHW
ncbi:MAG: hypothetical protein EOP86_13530 [Verrucomicrobiaceae bacterium]|nr:MAG: hypothetical protein EOP86_13530 [Verrucomicrobiaceae bacterium]